MLTIRERLYVRRVVQALPVRVLDVHQLSASTTSLWRLARCIFRVGGKPASQRTRRSATTAERRRTLVPRAA